MTRKNPMVMRLLAIATIVAALSTTSEAAEVFDELSGPLNYPDLKFPDKPQPLASGRESMMFKPDGAGPFPALVIMPTCNGHLYTENTFDWAKRAVEHGYAALVVDPLAPRGVDSNCVRPLPVPASRVLTDAFDAADHLRQQSFVDPARIGLLGFSQGAMIGLGAAGSIYSRLGEREPFGAIVSVYPVCLFDSYPMQGMLAPVDIRYVPERIVVPLFVEIGDQDTQGGPPMNGCKTLLEERKYRDDPIELVLYHATHLWDHRELGTSGERTRGVYGQEILYQYNADVTEQSSKDAFAFLDAHMKRP
jgi:dienelactone hydrolase